MDVRELLNHRLLFFTGKGGVGKSTVVASLAVVAARLGMRPLIAEIHTKSAMKQIFGAPFVGFVPLEITDNIWAINISAEESLLEYIEQHVKIRRLAKLIVKNKILKYFFDTAPAVNELVTINKLWNLVNERESATGAYTYDTILVDLPSTGHALSFLDLPRSIRQLVSIGPLRSIVDRYERMFTDPSMTALNLVTLPEEMPVTETIELYRKLTLRSEIPFGMLFVNGVPMSVFDENEADLMDWLNETAMETDELAKALMAGRAALGLQRRSDGHIRELAKSIKLNLITLPKLLIGRLDADAVEQLADAIPCD